jgi:hypothetical protein
VILVVPDSLPALLSSHAQHHGVAPHLHPSAGSVRGIVIKSDRRIIESTKVFEQVEQLDGDITAWNQRGKAEDIVMSGRP